MNIVYIVSGPTASGKTEYAVKLARRLGFKSEIISADSRQVYKGMTIGTGAPTLIRGCYRGVRHHLIGAAEPAKTYTAYDFQKDAYKLIEHIQRRGKKPIIVGGTGLWLRTLKEGLDFQQTKPDLKLRKKLERDLQVRGLGYLVKKLKTLLSLPLKVRGIKGGYESSEIVTPLAPLTLRGGQKHLQSNFDYHNHRRVIRAIEILMQKSEYSQNMRSHKMRIEQNTQTPCTFKTILLSPSKKILNKRINKRVDEMVKKGLVKEVKMLLKKYKVGTPLPIRHPEFNSESRKKHQKEKEFKSFGFLDSVSKHGMTKIWQINESKLIKYPALTGIGYREIIDYLQGKTTLPEAIDLIKLHTRQYAKRQMTWFKKYS